MIKQMNLDFETGCYEEEAYDLPSIGANRYAENAEILLVAWSVDGEEPQVFDVFNNGFPDEVYQLLIDPNVIKQAYNARLEVFVYRM